MDKRILHHVFDADDNPLGVWRDVSSQVAYRWGLNGGPQSITLDLAREWGSAGEPGETASKEDMRNGNQIKTYVIDIDSVPDGVLVHQGAIREERFSLGRGVTRVTILPIASIQQDEWIEGPITLTNYDPTDMMRYFLDNAYMPGLTWDETNPSVGATHTETFQRQRLGQVMETIRSLAGGTWFWRINPDQSLTFNRWNLSATPDHVIMLDRETADSVEFVKSQVATKKKVIVYGFNGITNNQDGTTTITPAIIATATASDYDTEAPLDMPISNNRITDASTAARIARAYLEQFNRTFHATTIPITDNNLAPAGFGYDVERLRPGQTLAMRVPDLVIESTRWDEVIWDEFDWDGSELSAIQDTYVIQEIEYTPDRCIVHLEQRPLGTVRELVNQGDRLLLAETA